MNAIDLLTLIISLMSGILEAVQNKNAQEAAQILVSIQPALASASSFVTTLQQLQASGKDFNSAEMIQYGQNMLTALNNLKAALETTV